MRRQRIAAVIIAKNEEARIAACLESVKWCDEIVVVDDMSSDDTHSVCRRFKAKVVAHPLDEDYARQRNVGTDNTTSDWILQLDADERVSPELRNDIKKILSDNNSVAAYRLYRRNYFLGKFMRHGGWYERQPKLFKKGKARYSGAIHEQLKVDGRTGDLRSHLDHYPFRSISEFIQRQLYYAGIEARLLHEERGKIPIKEVKRHIFTRPAKLFLKLYIKKQGFRDGMHGFIFSILNAWRHFAIWSLYWNKYHKGGLKT